MARITWMIAVDHFREWKNVQRDFVKFDAAKTEKDAQEAKLLASGLSTAQLVTVAQTETSVSRQPRTREWVFTPEVSLGAAFRSLAPPVLL